MKIFDRRSVAKQTAGLRQNANIDDAYADDLAATDPAKAKAYRKSADDRRAEADRIQKLGDKARERWGT